MKKRIVLLMCAAVFVLTACTSQKKIESEDDFSVEADGASQAGLDELELSDEKKSGSDSVENQTQDELSLDAFAEEAKSEAPVKTDPAQDSDLVLEDELNSLNENGANEIASTKDAKPEELTLDEPAAPAAAAQSVEPDKMQNSKVEAGSSTPEIAGAEQVPPAMVTDPAMNIEDKSNLSAPANITNVLYKGNASGGTISINADRPLNYTTRFNQTTNQFVVEVQNSVIPQKLKRTLNTKDMASSIGSVDIYQKEGSSITRFVVQLREGSQEPIVQPEGSTILVVGGAVNSSEITGQKTPSDAASQASVAGPNSSQPSVPAYLDSSAEVSKDVEMAKIGSSVSEDSPGQPSPVSGLLNYENLEEFLMSNTKFYGKKLNFETTDTDTVDALKFLAEESGINLMFDDNLGNLGKVNVKLDGVPWDQAFVLILKSKNLAYKRQGNVIRIATVSKILEDEDKAIKLKEKKRKPEDYLVKRFFVGYIKAPEAKTKVSEYIDNFQKIKQATSAVGESSSRQDAKGSIIVDESNNSIIVTDTAENIKKVEEILAAIDIQPKQIQIEAKIVDANESFAKGLGVKWNLERTSNPEGKIGFLDTPSVKTSGQFTAGLTWANLDFGGTLSASIALGESQNKLKTLASPRITVISGKSATLQQSAKVEVPTTVISQNGTPTPSTKTEDVRLGIDVTPTATNEGTVSLQVTINRDTGGGGSQVVQRSAKTELFVRSGATAVVGGIYETVSNNNQEGLPGLRSIPVLGSLFRAKQESKSKTEIMIFLTPTILRGI